MDCGTLGLAAARVGRSQSAVSMPIKRLEDDIGRPLLERQGRSLRPNAAAQQLVLRARRLLRLSDEALASLKRPETIGTLRLGVPEDCAASRLGPAPTQLGQDLPLAEISPVFETSPSLLRHLAAGQPDLALVTREPGPPFSVLRQRRFVWAAVPGHGVWARDPLPVALSASGDIARRFAIEALRDQGRACRVASSSQSLFGQISMAKAGLAVVGLARSCVPPALVILGDAEGMPALPGFDLSLLTAPGEPGQLANRLASRLRRELAR